MRGATCAICTTHSILVRVFRAHIAGGTVRTTVPDVALTSRDLSRQGRRLAVGWAQQTHVAAGVLVMISVAGLAHHTVSASVPVVAHAGRQRRAALRTVGRRMTIDA